MHDDLARGAAEEPAVEALFRRQSEELHAEDEFLNDMLRRYLAGGVESSSLAAGIEILSGMLDLYRTMIRATATRHEAERRAYFVAGPSWRKDPAYVRRLAAINEFVSALQAVVGAAPGSRSSDADDDDV